MSELSRDNLFSAEDIAAYCIYYCYSNELPGLSNLKLQKILYYIQAAFLVKFKKPCFHNKIVAWRYGPVVEELYYQLKKYGGSDLGLESCPSVYSQLSADEIDLIEKVCKCKGQYSGGQLINMTHEEEPWRCAKQSGDISIEMIYRYFKDKSERIFV